MLFEFDPDQVALFVRLKGTAIRRIYLTVIAYILYVTGIVAVHFYYHPLGLFNSIVGVLGVIVSLLLGFRTNSAHNKYDAGRKAWSALKTTIRTLTRTIWINAPTNTSKELIATKTAINLLDAFCYSLKHYLRQEYSGAERDIEPFIKQIPKFELRHTNVSKKAVVSKRDPYLACSFRPPTNIPHEIIYQLTLYAKAVSESSPSVNPGIWRIVAAGIASLEMSLSQLEELNRTPIPVCYSAHLSHALWIYLLVMPFQFLNNLGWWVIPNLAITFFAFEGCMSISEEMEDPFGYDANDLPLDMFCWTIRKELSQVTSELTPEFGSWACAKENRPLYPYDSISADEWSSKSLDEARNLLLNLRFDMNPVERNREDWKKAFREDAATPAV